MNRWRPRQHFRLRLARRHAQRRVRIAPAMQRTSARPPFGRLWSVVTPGRYDPHGGEFKRLAVAPRGRTQFFLRKPKYCSRKRSSKPLKASQNARLEPWRDVDGAFGRDFGGHQPLIHLSCHVRGADMTSAGLLGREDVSHAREHVLKLLRPAKSAISIHVRTP